MKQQNIIKKAMASLLVFCLMAGCYGSSAYAETISETNEVSENQQEDTSEETSADETAVTEESISEESTEKSTAEESISETEIMVQTETAVIERHKITGFVPLDDSERTVTCSYNDKPTEDELLSELPHTLRVYLDNGTEAQEIPVSWKCAGDFDNTAFFYYEYDPVWDDEVYTLSGDEQIPYIGVHLYTIETLSITNNDNETKIYDYLIHTMGFNTAAASGILANIYCESSFNPNVYSSDGSSYGICQWRDGSDVKRFTALKNYTKNWQTLEGQLAYLNYELTTDYPNLLSRLKSVNNNAEGAYQAAYDWCMNFEIPADTKNVAVSRGNLARDTYWPYYSGANNIVKDDISISGVTVPHQMKKGSSFDIRGTITSKYKLTSVTVGVYDCDDVMQIGQTAAPNSTSYDLRKIDTSIKFGSLAAGGYRYKVTAKTSAGTTTLVNCAFMVLGNSLTVADGTYYIESMKNTGYGLNVSGSSSASGGNIVLGAKSSSNYMKFALIYQDNGYYKIKNVGSGKYLGVTGQKSASGTNVEQSTDGTRWQVIPDGKGSYYLVPECSSTAAVDLTNGTVANGTNIRIWNYNLSEGQRWKLESISTSTAAPTISGQTKPSTMKAGTSFDIRGTITSGQTLTEVTVGVYDTSGSMKIGKTVQPNAKSYDLRNVDTSIKFGSLSTGGHRYKVTAKTGAGTTTLVNSTFMVLGSSRTVADGTYYIESMKNTGYGLNVSGSSNASGGNIVLGAKSSSNYMKFILTYQDNGYYKIKNVGSGKYLGVTGQKSASGTNVEQSASGTRWQVIPDGKGSYYLVPECSSTAAVDLTNGTVAGGTNIRIWNYNLTEGQRWKLESTSTSTAAPTISGQTKPSTMKAGKSFDIRGTITSGQTLTEVTVGVYDTSGIMKIGKTVKPNAKSYDLRNVDTSIKFGSLSTGGYRYKVTAKTGAGTTTLVNSTFMVLGSSRTVADGTYYIESMKNTGYGLNASGNSSASGGNIVLGAKSSSNYMKFVLTYQDNGYYKIKNVGSGKYLGVTGQKSASGTNVEQSTSGTRWQVIPDGKGSYYLVPECSSTAAVDLTNGTVAGGTNIRIWNYNLTEGQRWRLEK